MRFDITIDGMRADSADEAKAIAEEIGAIKPGAEVRATDPAHWTPGADWETADENWNGDRTDEPIAQNDPDNQTWKPTASATAHRAA